MAGKDYYDEAFAQIAQRAGSIHSLLDEFFSFLHRRTDFYVQYDINKVERPSMGFPQGKAEDILLKAYRKYPSVPYETTQQGPNKVAAETSSPDIAKNKQSAPSSNSSVQAAASKPPPKEVQPTLQYNESGKQIPIGNGGIGDNYYWTQSLTELTIYVNLPSGVRSKNVQVEIKPRQLRVALAGQVLLEGGLEDPVQTSESMWTLSDGQLLVVSLEKCRETWWKSAIVGHAEIDTTKVDSTKKISEYDADTQAAIRKIVHEQRMKMMGQKTEEELKMEELMAKIPPPPIHDDASEDTGDS